MLYFPISEINLKSPNNTFIIPGRIHFRSNWTLKISAELFHVGERTLKKKIHYQEAVKERLMKYLDPEHVGRVNSSKHPEFERHVSVLGTPHAGPAQPEQLGLGEAEAGETRLLSVRGRPGL